jgi:acyl-CoA hydrolase
MHDLRPFGEPLATGIPTRNNQPAHNEPRIEKAHGGNGRLSASRQAPSLDNFPDRYRHKLTTTEDALKVIESGQRVYIGGGCGEPIVLAQGLVNRAPELRDVEIIHVLTAGHAAYADQGLAGSFRVNSLFIAPNVRGAVQSGQADFTPVFLSEIPRLFREGHLAKGTCRLTWR